MENTTEIKKYKICKIRRDFKRNGGTPIENFFYAELRDAKTNELEIAADVDYILKCIIERKLILADDII